MVLRLLCRLLLLPACLLLRRIALLVVVRRQAAAVLAWQAAAVVAAGRGGQKTAGGRRVARGLACKRAVVASKAGSQGVAVCTTQKPIEKIKEQCVFTLLPHNIFQDRIPIHQKEYCGAFGR